VHLATLFRYESIDIMYVHILIHIHKNSFRKYEFSFYFAHFTFFHYSKIKFSKSERCFVQDKHCTTTLRVYDSTCVQQELCATQTVYNTNCAQQYVYTTLPVYNTTSVKHYLFTTLPLYNKPLYNNTCVQH
jgi:hypothetical protein